MGFNSGFKGLNNRHTLVISDTGTSVNTSVIENVPFVVSRSTVALAHRKSAFNGPLRDTCRRRGHDKRQLV